jgi:uncharacterized membrane-anchored protein YhcB (DUF1043 family)
VTWIIAGACLVVYIVIALFVLSLCRAAAPRNLAERMKQDEEQAKYFRERTTKNER